ncbi:MAG: cysteine--tRNA ligase [Planctomycetaceae bacterium]
MRLHNTLSGRVEEFAPLHSGEARLYHCGPTVYSRPHIGNYRAYMMADLLRRTFEYLGWRTRQVMNITDVGHLTEDEAADASGEDKLEKAARGRKLDPWQIAREVEGWFHEDLALLRILPAHRYPRATEHIPEMIAQIETLIAKGHAYAVDGNVYFSVKSFAEYGKLSGNTLDKLEAGARVEVREEKRDPLDFALWKRDEKHLMQWDSPWGRGFPGWHIECSAMSMKYLGDTIDIHTGGPDNRFPHHECEIAQAEGATGKPFVRFWVHNAFLEIGGTKMAKRAGTLFLLPELVAMGYEGADIRAALLQPLYRSPIQFDLEALDAARAGRARLDNFVNHEMSARPAGPRKPEAGAAIAAARTGFRAALENDLNTPEAFAAVHEMVTALNRLGVNRSDADDAAAAMRDFDRVLAILDAPPAARAPDTEVEALLAEREAARKARDFARADALRDELAKRGVEILDTPQGTRWKRS